MSSSSGTGAPGAPPPGGGTFDSLSDTPGTKVALQLIQVDAGASFLEYISAISDTQHGSRGGGSLHAVATGAVAGFLSAADKSKLDGIEAGATADQTLTAGAGLTGGGTGDVTFDVVANADGSIVVNANDLQVGVLASDAQHGNLGGGALHVVATGAVAGFMSAADKTKLDTYPASFPFQHDLLSGQLDDDHTIYALLSGIGRGGQTLFGGTGAGDLLTFQGADNADVGRIAIASPIDLTYHEGNTTPAEQSVFNFNGSFTTAGAFIGGPMHVTTVTTYTNAFYIYSTCQDNSVHISNAALGFQAWVYNLALSTITRGTSNALVQALVFSAAVVHENDTVSAATATQNLSFQASPQIRCGVAGGSMSWSTGGIGYTFAPKHSAVIGSTVNMGSLIAYQVQLPGVALFQPTGGTVTATEIIGLDWPNMASFGGNIPKAAVRSAQAQATNAYCILHTGSAQSVLGGNLQFTGDLIGTLYGGAVGSPDYRQAWAAGNFFFQQFEASGEQLRTSNPSADRFLFDTDGGNTVAEYTNNCQKWSAGPQTGALGNTQFGFVGGGVTITVGGDYTQVLHTQALNDTVDAALGTHATHSMNVATPALGTGSVSTQVGLNIGGNGTQGSVNRAAVRILSNPSGGSGVNAALWITAGNTQLDGTLTHTGANCGLYGAPIVTQAADPVALTDSTGGTANNTVAAVSGSGDDATINDNFADLTAKYNALRDMLSEAAGGIGIAA